MVASLEYSKIQTLICNNSIAHRIIKDTYNSVHMKYNNKHKSRLWTVGLRSIILKIHLTVQLFSVYYLLYKEMSFLAALESMFFFSKDLALTMYTLFGEWSIKTM